MWKITNILLPVSATGFYRTDRYFKHQTSKFTKEVLIKHTCVFITFSFITFSIKVWQSMNAEKGLGPNAY